MRIKGLPIVRSGTALPFRASEDPVGSGAAAEGTLGRLWVRFSPFDTPYEINSWFEGRFIERTSPGAFRKTIQESKRSDGKYATKVLYNHGSDFNIGDKLLTVADRLAEVNSDGYHGPELEGDLYDTSYNRDLLPGLRDGAYGSSFMFEVIKERWDNEPGESDENPEGLPERTIEEVRLFEAGPVTWPASPTASAGMRGLSGTDGWMERLASRSKDRHERLVRSYEALRGLYKVPEYKPGNPTLGEIEPPSRQFDEAAIKREARLRAHRFELMKAR